VATAPRGAMVVVPWTMTACRDDCTGSPRPASRFQTKSPLIRFPSVACHLGAGGDRLGMCWDTPNREFAIINQKHQ
jgi:hypothetical protein